MKALAALATVFVLVACTSDPTGPAELRRASRPPFVLTATKQFTSAGYTVSILNWTGARTSQVSVYQNGAFKVFTPNNGVYRDSVAYTVPATYVWKLCEKGSSRCSNTATTSFP